MGTVADAALEAGASVLGVIPRRLVARELGHRGIQELRVVDTMHERKLQMAQAADAFVALPGGLGTLEELFEVWTWQQLGYHARPIGLLDTAGFYAPLQALLAHTRDAGFVGADQVSRLRAAACALDDEALAIRSALGLQSDLKIVARSATRETAASSGLQIRCI